jgi:PEP-CTERM motif
MTNRLHSFLFAAAAIFGLGAFAIGPVHALAPSTPPASDFIATAEDGTITITNNSTGWYIWGFGVVDITGSDPATTFQNWEAGPCNNNCGGPGFDGMGFAYQNPNGSQNPLSDDIIPGQTTSLFTYTDPPSTPIFQLYITNVDNLGGVYIIPAGSTVPEPATWAMLIAGFGFLGWRYGLQRSGHKRLSRAA